MASSARPKATRSANYYLSSTTWHWNTYHHRAMRLTDHHMVETKRQLKPNTSLAHLIAKAEVN